MDGGTPTSTRALAVGTLLLALAGCAGSGPGIDSTQPIDEPAPPVAQYVADPEPTVSPTAASTSEPGTTNTVPTTTTAGVTTTAPETAHGASTQDPDADVEHLDLSELSGLLHDLDQVLGNLDATLGDLGSSLTQEEGELFND